MVTASRQCVEVIHLAESFQSNKLVGKNVSWAEHQLRHPLNIPRDHAARLNGRLAQPGDTISPGDVLVFHARRGRKGRDEMFTPTEFLTATGLKPEEYEYLLARGMPVLEFSGSPQLVMGEVGKWIQGQEGVFAAAAQTVFARARLRVNKHDGAATFDGTPYPITFEQALILIALLEHVGQWVNHSEVEHEADMPLGRLDRPVKKLPKPLAKLIDSSTKGYRLRLE